MTTRRRPISVVSPHPQLISGNTVTLPARRRLNTPMKPNMHLDGWVTWMRAWGAALTTIDNRVLCLTAALEVWPDPLTVGQPHVAAWLAGFSGWTKVTYYGHARSFFSYLVETGARSDDPTAKMRAPTRPASAPHPFSGPELDLLDEHLEGRLATWMLLARRQGFRRHEIAKVRGEDVREDVTWVFGKGGKGVYLPTNPEVWAAAQEYPSRGFWFPPLTASPRPHVTGATVGTRTAEALRQVGISGSIHRGRHTFATELLRAGVNVRVVQRLMRHSSLATTEAYLDATDDEMRLAINLLAA